MNNFTEEEILAAKQMKAWLLDNYDPYLLAVYMAGEICMFIELQEENGKNEQK